MNSRHAIAIFAAVFTAVLIVGLNCLPGEAPIWTAGDFLEYWAAAKLTLADKNPYDADQLLPLQRSAGSPYHGAVMMWNPPWALAVVLPLGLLPAREASFLWLAANLLAILYCGDRCWILLGGSRRRRWVGWLIVVAAFPTHTCFQWGQISPLLLLGAVLFLECQLSGRQFAAGAATVLLAIKPHAAFLIWVALGVDAMLHGRWRAIAGGVVTAIACVLIVLVCDPGVLQQYADAMGNRPPNQWATPTLGTALRYVLGQHLFRLQFIPAAFGLAWFAIYQQRSILRSPVGLPRDWRSDLPLLLLVSIMTAPYAWQFDMVLLLPMAMWLVIHTDRPLRGWIVAGLVAMNLGGIVTDYCVHTSFWFLWIPAAMLALYLISRSLRPCQVPVPESVEVNPLLHATAS